MLVEVPIASPLVASFVVASIQVELKDAIVVRNGKVMEDRYIKVDMSGIMPPS